MAQQHVEHIEHTLQATTSENMALQAELKRIRETKVCALRVRVKVRVKC